MIFIVFVNCIVLITFFWVIQIQTIAHIWLYISILLVVIWCVQLLIPLLIILINVLIVWWKFDVFTFIVNLTNFIINFYNYVIVEMFFIIKEKLNAQFFLQTITMYTTYFNDFWKYVLKKYIYTINHKRIAINYLIFCLVSGMAGTLLATMIRIELAMPGSFFFKYDSVRYLQVITAHGLTMVFFVVIPLVFGAVANFIIPYHIGSKDVAFPRLNSLGFWLLPSGYVLLAKPAFIRSEFQKPHDVKTYYFNFIKHPELTSIFNNLDSSLKVTKSDTNTFSFFDIPVKSVIFQTLVNSSDSLWYITTQLKTKRIKKKSLPKSSNSSLTMAGWTFITPFSSKTRFTGLGAQDIAIITVILSGVSTTISFTNLLITRRTLSAPGLRNRRVLIPFLTITLFLVMRMLALITPVLGAAMIMLLLDRHWNTTFFDYAYGGDIVLFNHLFWFFGHPEVYVVIIPAFGIVNMMLPYYNTRRIASKHHLIWATYIMGYMGFLVWGHHMYLVGLDHRSRSLYSTVTVMISLPAIVKLINWTLSILNGALKIDTAILFINSFFFFFLCGGLTGMWLSHVGLNVYVHDTFYVVAHFHFMFSSSTFSAIFALTYYYYSVLFGIKYSKIFSLLHLIYWTCGQWLTFLPLFWIGYNGLPRRYHDYPIFYMGWHGLATIGHFLVLVSIIFFFLGLAESFLEKKIYTHNTLGIPRFNKRINYYLFKVRYIQYVSSINNNNLNYNQYKIINRDVYFEIYK